MLRQPHQLDCSFHLLCPLECTRTRVINPTQATVVKEIESHVNPRFILTAKSLSTNHQDLLRSLQAAHHTQKLTGKNTKSHSCITQKSYIGPESVFSAPWKKENSILPFNKLSNSKQKHFFSPLKFSHLGTETIIITII